MTSISVPPPLPPRQSASPEWVLVSHDGVNRRIRSAGCIADFKSNVCGSRPLPAIDLPEQITSKFALAAESDFSLQYECRSSGIMLRVTMSPDDEDEFLDAVRQGFRFIVVVRSAKYNGNWPSTTPSGTKDATDVFGEWKCSLGRTVHDYFVSYRVETDKDLAEKLTFALEAHFVGYPDMSTSFGTVRPVHVFLDKYCLVSGRAWEDGFISGLRYSRIVLLCVSEDALERVKHADSVEDNLFLEWEIALEENRTKGTEIVPLLIGKYINGADIGAIFPENDGLGSILFRKRPKKKVAPITRSLKRFSDFNVSKFSANFHSHSRSPRLASIRQTMRNIFALQGIHVDPEDLQTAMSKIHRIFATLPEYRTSKISPGELRSPPSVQGYIPLQSIIPQIQPNAQPSCDPPMYQNAMLPPDEASFYAPLRSSRNQQASEYISTAPAAPGSRANSEAAQSELPKSSRQSLRSSTHKQQMPEYVPEYVGPAPGAILSSRTNGEGSQPELPHSSRLYMDEVRDLRNILRPLDPEENEELLQELASELADPDSQSFALAIQPIVNQALHNIPEACPRFWIIPQVHGVLPSVAAAVIAQRLDYGNCLGGALFLGELVDYQEDAAISKIIVCTIAYFICVAIPDFGRITRKICVNQKDKLNSLSVEELHEVLIVAPLRQLMHTFYRCVIIVVDGLDLFEVSEYPMLYNLFLQLSHKLPIGIAFMMTTRTSGLEVKIEQSSKDHAAAVANLSPSTVTAHSRDHHNHELPLSSPNSAQFEVGKSEKPAIKLFSLDAEESSF
ncbi:hypothetical protein HDU83_007395 [Entophlyctis luteolus]|nr:hypothetical protein HDU83_007395 [Entophlyctis luteolus]